MQRYALTVDKFLDHAAKWHSRAGIVSSSPAHGITRASYPELRARSLLVSGGLLNSGLKIGDRIATLAWNTLDHLTLYYAAMGVGLICHTLNPRFSASHLAAMINEAGDRWLAVGAELRPLLREILPLCPSVEAVLWLDGQESEASFAGKYQQWPLDEFINSFGRETRWGDFDEETPAGLCYSSGTVAEPRGVLYTHRSNYLHTLRSLQADSFAITGHDVVLVAVPMYHANGWGLPFAGPAVGATMVLPGRHTDPAHLKSLILSERVTVAAAVQTVWLALVELLESEGGDLPSLKRVVVGGSHCPDALADRIEDRLSVLVQTSWGMTELSPLGTIVPVDEPRTSRPRTSGRPPMGLDMKLVDSGGVALPQQRNVVGRLRVKGPSVADKYFNGEPTALDSEGYLDTGDLASIDDAGNLTIAGRTKDLIKSGGEWINPREIEEIVAGHPAVGLVAVVARPDPKWGERPVLIVELRKNQSLEDRALLETLRGKVPDWWLPDRVVILERIPLAATGKIDKKRLRAEFGSQ